MMESKGQKTYREIYGQPASYRAIIDTLPEITAVLKEVFSEHYDQLIFTGCGTSLYLAQTAAYVFRKYNRTPAVAVCCSELYYAPENYLRGDRNLVLPITRKSYTTEVRRAIDRIRTYPGVTSLAITCDADSSLYNDHFVLCPDTAEDSVIMTRSFTAMIMMAEIVSLCAAGREKELASLKALPEMAEETIPAMDRLAKKIIGDHDGLNLYITLGQGMQYGIANESMNKMKEMSLSNSEAYYTMEYRHGPMSLVDENTLIVMLSVPSTLAEDRKMMRELEGYGGHSVVLGPDPVAVGGEYTLQTGRDDLTCAVLGSVFAQLVGYHASQKKGLDCDSPRHLSQAIVLK